MQTVPEHKDNNHYKTYYIDPEEFGLKIYLQYGCVFPVLPFRDFNTEKTDNPGYHKKDNQPDKTWRKSNNDFS